MKSVCRGHREGLTLMPCLNSRCIQGFDCDSSDDEWDVHVREEFGTRGPGFGIPVEQELDTGMDLTRCVQHAFQIYDGLAGGIGNDIGEEDTDNFQEFGPNLDQEGAVG